MSGLLRSGIGLPSWGGVALWRRALLTAPEWLWAAACYTLLAAALLWPALAFGQVPLPLMNAVAQGDPFWSAVPGDAGAGANRLLGDVSGFYYPYAAFAIDRLRAGDLPLWNPYIFGGVPFFAASQAALLYPVNLLTFWLGPHAYWAAAALIRLLIAGAGTHLLLRRLGARPLGALAAGAVYMLADFNIVWLNFAIHNVAALLPLALWMIAGLAARPSRRDALALAAVVAAQMLGGHPEMSLFFMAVCGIFALCWLLAEGRGAASGSKPHSSSAAGGRWSMVALAFTLGLALSAVQWLPTALLIRTSYTLEERGFAASRGAGGMYAPLGAVREAGWENMRHWLMLVAPELWGSPRGAEIRYWGPESSNYNELTPFVGLTALALALFGALRGRNRRAARFFGATLLASLLLLFPLPGLHYIGFLPLLDVAHGFRFGLGVALAAAVLAGMGVDRLAESLGASRAPLAGLRQRARRPLPWEVRRRGNPARREALLLALACALLAAVSLAVVADLWGGRGGELALGFAPSDAQRAQIASVYAWGNWRLLLPAASGLLAAALLAWLALRPAGGTLRVGLVAAVAAGELLAHGFGYNGFTRPEAIYPRTAAAAYLAASDGRVLNLDDALWANSAMTQGIEVTGGMDDLKPGHQGRFLRRGMAGIAATPEGHAVQDWGRRLMELMGVRHIVAARPVTGGAELSLVMREGALLVYRNERALPRAFAAFAAVPVTGREAEDVVFGAGFDPWASVAVEGELPAALPRGRGAPIQPVEIVSYAPDRVELLAELDAPGVVVLADAYDAGWRVSVNGAEAPLLRANAMFRGVAVPRGVSRIVFTYRPQPVLWGALISLAALVACVGLASAPRRHGAWRLPAPAGRAGHSLP